MAVYLISGNYDYESRCPFGVSFVAPTALKNPVTHLKFVAANSTCIIDMDSDYDISKLPISTENVKVVPMFGKDFFNDKVIAIMTHVFPQHAAFIRRCYMYGEEYFADSLRALSETHLWQKTVDTYLSGLEV